ncbi:MAG: exodeoxyribonuclease VII large subunit [Sphingopyxis sp.]|nr:exodeoxyribonuclease VII large subunit [Sphingopyxis sp.]
MSDPFADETDGAPARLLAEGAAGDNAPALSVSQLSAALKRVVEDGFGRVRVRGELSGTKRAASGHLYGALKDDSALIDMVMWKGQAGRLAFRPEDGVEVIATGRLTTYPGRSKYQLVADSLEVAGEGALMLLFERLKARLRAEGLFDREKQPLPRLPRTIGVVTSPTGAVIRDILHRIADRFPVRVIVWPVLVQGEGAGSQVAAAVRGFDALPANGGAVPRPDLVIVARGGGSIEDLWAFNEEAVVRAIADCRIPTISAVGHETDVTLADHAADVRAPTPTAAAELALPVRSELAAALASIHARGLQAALRLRGRSTERLTALARLLPRRDALYAGQRQRLDELAERLARGVGGITRSARDRLTQRVLRPALLRRRIEGERGALGGLVRLLISLDPRALLARGYAMVRSEDDALVTTAAAARRLAAMQLVFVDGTVRVSTVGSANPARRAPPAAPQADLFGD